MWVNVINEWQAFQIYLLRIKRLMDGFNVILNYYPPFPPTPTSITQVSFILLLEFVTQVSRELLLECVNDYIERSDFSHIYLSYRVIANILTLKGFSLLINPESSKQNWICCKCSSAAKSKVAPVVSHGHILSAPDSHTQKCVYQSSTRAEILILVMWLNLARKKKCKATSIVKL